MKTYKTHTRLLSFVLMLVFCLGIGSVTTYAESNTSLITKFLNSYKEGDFTTANKYAEQMKKTDRDTSLKKMSSNQKIEYLKVLKKYNLIRHGFSGEHYVWGYYLADLNKDRLPELLIKTGSCEADAHTDIYTCKRGKVKKITSIGSGHSSYYAYPRKGIVVLVAHMGCANTYVLRMEGSKIITEKYGGQFTQSGDYCMMKKVSLDNHARYKNYNLSIDVRDLQ